MKPYEIILIYDIWYKTSTDAKPLRIRFDKIDGFVIIKLDAKYYLIVIIVIKFVISLNIL